MRGHLCNFQEDGIQGEGLELDDLLAAEGEKLARQLRRPHCRTHNACGAGQGWAFQFHAQQFGLGHDDHEQVVEVVGDSAGEPANGFHLLRLEKLRLQEQVGFPLLFGLLSQAQRAPAESQIGGKLGDQGEFPLLKGIFLGGVQGEAGNGLAFDDQGKTNR